MQRSQEILMMLIEKIIESKKIIEEIKRLSTIVKNLKKK
jgi:hypothetical protein